MKPNIALTDAGRALISGKRPQEIFLRQLLKFQLPSPYHTENAKISGTFFVRPYLEVLRLIYDLEYLTFDELKIFAVQITDYHKYEEVKDKILNFRKDKELHRGQYKRFVNDVWANAVLEIHNDRIAEGRTRTRETRDASINTFVKTQKGNMRDYADACFRYLRFTGLVSIAHKSRKFLFSMTKNEMLNLSLLMSIVTLFLWMMRIVIKHIYLMLPLPNYIQIMLKTL